MSHVDEENFTVIQSNTRNRCFRRAITLVPLLLAFLLPFYAGVTTSEAKQSPPNLPIVETYGKLPLYFIQNNGQVDEKVKFYEKGSGHATYFTKEGVYISLVRGEKSDDRSKKLENTSQLVKLSFLNANPNPDIIAVDQQEGKVNYFIGNDPRKWKTNIQTYKAVVYKEVYPGIDIKFYGNNRQMEYDVIVKPGADPSQVRFAYEGIEGLKVTENGDMEIILKEGKIIQKKPIIYQEIDGKKVAIDGKFVIKELEVTSVIARPQVSKQSLSYNPSPLAGEVQGEGDSGSVPSRFVYTFELASYDKTHQIIIDPVLIYSTYLGGINGDWGNAIAVDVAGNSYITGWTNSFDFPASTLFGTGGGDAFVTKIDSTGGSLLYSVYLGGGSHDFGNDIAVDLQGNAYITGVSRSADFPTANALYGTYMGGPNDVFITKIDVTGSQIVFSTYLGGSNNDEAHGIAVDILGNAYITGATFSNDFPVSSPLYGTKSNDWDAFVTKINTLGSGLVFSSYLGGSGSDSGNDIAVDNTANIYITGSTSSSNFPVVSAFQQFYGGNSDAFILKIDNSGNNLAYSTYLGGSGEDISNSIAVDTTGNVYITGGTFSTNFPTNLPIYGNCQSCSGPPYYLDAFITKINALGNNLSGVCT